LGAWAQRKATLAAPNSGVRPAPHEQKDTAKQRPPGGTPPLPLPRP
jgi:hypothetical protein